MNTETTPETLAGAGWSAAAQASIDVPSATVPLRDELITASGGAPGAPEAAPEDFELERELEREIDADAGRAQLEAERSAPPRRTRRVRRQPRWLDAVVDVHAAARRPLPIAVDAGLIVAACALAGISSLPQLLGWAAVLVAACYGGQLYTDRDSVQTQGVLWFVLRPLAAVDAVAFTAAASGLLAPQVAGWMAGWSLLLLVGLRCILAPLLALARRQGLALRRTLIVGADETAARLWRRLVEFPEAGLVPVQMLDWSVVAHRQEALLEEIVRHDIRHVVLVAHRPETLRITGSLRGDSERPVYFSVVPGLADLFVNPSAMTTVAGIPLVPMGQVMRHRRGYAGKRILDILGSTLLLAIASPVMLLTALAIKLDDGGPVLYRQSRVGLDGKTFRMVKFRSMRVGADRMVADLAAQNAADGLLFKMHRDPRVTRVGQTIRRLSIDELPQLLNVVAGQMSLVGPRPLPVAPEDFDAWDNERHATLPGITGYWQISGGNALGYDEMVRLDLAYVRNASLSLDLRLLLRTVPALLHRKGPS